MLTWRRQIDFSSWVNRYKGQAVVWTKNWAIYFYSLLVNSVCTSALFLYSKIWCTLISSIDPNHSNNKNGNQSTEWDGPRSSQLGISKYSLVTNQYNISQAIPIKICRDQWQSCGSLQSIKTSILQYPVFSHLLKSASQSKPILASNNGKEYGLVKLTWNRLVWAQNGSDMLLFAVMYFSMIFLLRPVEGLASQFDGYTFLELAFKCNYYFLKVLPNLTDFLLFYNSSIKQNVDQNVWTSQESLQVSISSFDKSSLSRFKALSLLLNAIDRVYIVHSTSIVKEKIWRISLETIYSMRMSENIAYWKPEFI